jgi:hypothetical protein
MGRGSLSSYLRCGPKGDRERISRPRLFHGSPNQRTAAKNDLPWSASGPASKQALLGNGNQAVARTESSVSSQIRNRSPRAWFCRNWRCRIARGFSHSMPCSGDAGHVSRCLSFPYHDNHSGADVGARSHRIDGRLPKETGRSRAAPARGSIEPRSRRCGAAAWYSPGGYTGHRTPSREPRRENRRTSRQRLPRWPRVVAKAIGRGRAGLGNSGLRRFRISSLGTG